MRALKEEVETTCDDVKNAYVPTKYAKPGLSAKNPIVVDYSWSDGFLGKIREDLNSMKRSPSETVREIYDQHSLVAEQMIAAAHFMNSKRFSKGSNAYFKDGSTNRIIQCILMEDIQQLPKSHVLVKAKEDGMFYSVRATLLENDSRITTM